MKNRGNCRGIGAFTLVELLVVIAVIGLLAGLILAAAAGVRGQAARSQAKTDIGALEAALVRFQLDNGFFPHATSADPTQVGPPSGYLAASQTLFTNLMGRTIFTNTPAAGLKAYLNPKPTLVGSGSTPNFFSDPWGDPYGYHWDSTNSTSPYGKAVPDIWSVAGQRGTGTQTNRAKWICSWIN